VAKSEKPPRYVAIADRLEEELRGLGPNSLLPTEEQLALRFDVSRVTIRGALDLLERSGLVSRLRGRGTIVSPPKVTRRFSPLYSFERDLSSQGIKFATRILSVERRAESSEDIRRRLNLGKNARVCCISLVRLVDDRIVCHHYRYYPLHVGQKLDPRQLETRDAAGVLEEAVRDKIVGVDWESEILPVSPEIATALEVASRTLVFTNTYTWRVNKGVPVEAGVVSYRVDRCKFKYEINFDRSVRLEATPPLMASAPKDRRRKASY
jgi:GntR family transcriptional regulator